MDRCAVRVGRLIDHPCGRGHAKPCKKCGKPACKRHRDGNNRCAACTGALPESTASITLEDLGDPMDFAPEVYAAFQRRAGAPDDELAGVDS
ncbi:MAG: hypothetical protein R3F61_35790 [Myxococcota bacterium]